MLELVQELRQRKMTLEQKLRSDVHNQAALDEQLAQARAQLATNAARKQRALQELAAVKSSAKARQEQLARIQERTEQLQGATSRALAAAEAQKMERSQHLGGYE